MIRGEHHRASQDSTTRSRIESTHMAFHELGSQPLLQQQKLEDDPAPGPARGRVGTWLGLSSDK